MNASLFVPVVFLLGCLAPAPPAPAKIEVHLPPEMAENLAEWLSHPPAPCFSGLGDLSGGPVLSFANEISADARVISGEGFDGTETTVHGKGVTWTRTGSTWSIARVPHVISGSNDENIAFCVAGDGKSVGGYAADTADPVRPDYPYLYALGGPAIQLPFLDGHHSGIVHGLSENGAHAVGFTQDHSVGGSAYFTAADPLRQATLWSLVGGSWNRQDLPGSTGEGFATSISRNGKFLVGFATTAAAQPFAPGHDRGHEAVLWRQSGSSYVAQFLPPLSATSVNSRALDVSDNGAVVVGGSGRESDQVPVKWQVSTGSATVTGLGLPPGFQRGIATAVSPDGLTIVGVASEVDDLGNFVTGEAVIWSWWSGTMTLSDLLASQGITSHAGWLLLQANGIAVVGKTVWICGDAVNPDGDLEAFVCCLRRPTARYERPIRFGIPHWWNPEFPPPDPAFSIPGLPVGGS